MITLFTVLMGDFDVDDFKMVLAQTLTPTPTLALTLYP